MRRRRLSVAAVAIVLATAGLAAAKEAERSGAGDAWLTTKTKVAILTTIGTAGTDVNVDTVDGRVTLHGTVETDADERAAEKAARGVDGVKDVRNLLQVVKAKQAAAVDRKDEAIQKDVAAALAKDEGLAGSEISVQSVNAGTVLLAGTADSLSDHLRAIESAREVRGVRVVHSEITSPDRAADAELHEHASSKAGEAAAAAKAEAKDLKGAAADAWVTAAAKTRLLANGKTPGRDINVDTSNGVVTLFGTVPSEDSKATAEHEVAKVSGVKRIENELEVVPASEKKMVGKSDGKTAAAVEAALGKDPALADAKIRVEVANGVARLTGTAASETDRVKAKALTAKVAGVKSVEDEVQIGAAEDAE